MRTRSFQNTRKLTRTERFLSRLEVHLVGYAWLLGQKDWEEKNYPFVRRYTRKERLAYLVIDLLERAEEKISKREWEKVDRVG